MNRRRIVYAVKVAGPRAGSKDVYWKEPGSKKRAIFECECEAERLAEREGGYVVEVLL